MKLIVLNKVKGGRLALLPTGQLVLSEVLPEPVSPDKQLPKYHPGQRVSKRAGDVIAPPPRGPATKILIQGQSLLVDMPFEQLCENINAEVEGWKA
jgi:hypothetical protein